MLNKMFLSGRQVCQIIWIATFSICSLILLFTQFETSEALASSIELASIDNVSPLNLQITDTLTSTLQIESTSTDNVSSPALQSTDSPLPSRQVSSTTVYSFSLATLGYDETTLTSPQGNAQYNFRIPENRSIETDGVLDLDLSYVYTQLDDTNGYPAFLGDLTIKLDGQTLEVFPIDERELDHYRLRVSLPSSLLADSDRVQHVIELTLDAGLLCEVPHKATLLIHPTSSISLNFGQRPLVLDLSRYPRPFYQRAFEPDSVRFVLPSQPTVADLTDALAVAAKLGDLTGKQLVISATTDLDLNRLLSSDPATFDEHLIVLGQPQANQLLLLLNEIVDLPVSLHQRQLKLVVEGPTAVAPDDTFTYTFTITNTINRTVNLSLINSLPRYTEIIDCTPDCAENGNNNTVTWSNLLESGETLSLSLMLKASDILTTGVVLENIMTLIEADLGPVNANTLTSMVVADSADRGLQTSVAGQDDYFFVYDGQSVATGDGIIQEILSPWNESRAILIITGLSDEAVRKASQAMSSEARFPGMSGQVALVRDALTPSEISDTISTAVEMTFEDLGYGDQIILGGSRQQIDYYFEVPYGWQLTDNAVIDLYFSHSQLIDYEDSGLTVFLNKQPVVSIALDEKTAGDGHARINLADANIQTRQPNRLSIQVAMSVLWVCSRQEPEQIWFLVKNNSKLLLAHEENTELGLDLAHFPSPFRTNRALTDLLFALTNDPTTDEVEIALHLAESLGSAAGGKTIVLAATIGGDLPVEDLAAYHIIAVGRPSRNTLIQQANAQLPQPFLPGSDEIEQRLDDVVFRLPLGADLGHVQLIPSPWNESRAFLAVTGTSDTGVRWATETLTGRPWTLDGNLALVRGDEVSTIDTRELVREGVARAVATAVPELTPVATTAAVTTTQPLPSPTPDLDLARVEATSSTENQPTWLIPLVGINGLVVLGIFAIAFWQARRK